MREINKSPMITLQDMDEAQDSMKVKKEDVTLKESSEEVRASQNEKIGFKVREHSLAKVPLIAVVGGREAAERTIALRRLGGKEQEFLALGDAVARLRAEAAAP